MIRFKLTFLLAFAFLFLLSDNIQGQTQSVPAVIPDTNSPLNPMIYNAPPPPPTGRPGRRSDAGSRGCETGEVSNLSEPTPLLALVPTQETATSEVVFGKTAAAHPTFWFYVPYSSAFTATFVLQDQDGNPIYESDVTLPQTAGIFGLTLPDATPLETGKSYHWFFKLYCRSISPPDAFVDGWIQREALPPNLAQQLATATPQQQVQIYAANGFWFEALTAAAELRQTNGEDSAWTDLLTEVGLENVSDEAIVMP